jgi:DNA-binding NarL/FixJ family response regulator
MAEEVGIGMQRRNLRPLRPIRILLASDDASFTERLSAAAGEQRLELSCVTTHADVDVELALHGSNVLVIDSNGALRRAARSATAFAALHPDIPVVVLADRASSRTVAGLLLLDKWRSTERLLGEIELAYLGLRP